MKKIVPLQPGRPNVGEVTRSVKSDLAELRERGGESVSKRLLILAKKFFIARSVDAAASEFRVAKFQEIDQRLAELEQRLDAS